MSKVENKRLIVLVVAVVVVVVSGQRGKDLGFRGLIMECHVPQLVEIHDNLLRLSTTAHWSSTKNNNGTLQQPNSGTPPPFWKCRPGFPSFFRETESYTRAFFGHRSYALREGLKPMVSLRSVERSVDATRENDISLDEKLLTCRSCSLVLP